MEKLFIMINYQHPKNQFYEYAPQKQKPQIAPFMQ